MSPRRLGTIIKRLRSPLSSDHNRARLGMAHEALSGQPAIAKDDKRYFVYKLKIKPCPNASSLLRRQNVRSSSSHSNRQSEPSEWAGAAWLPATLQIQCTFCHSVSTLLAVRPGHFPCVDLLHRYQPGCDCFCSEHRSDNCIERAPRTSPCNSGYA